jgi:cytochrome c oxidase subunit 3
MPTLTDDKLDELELDGGGDFPFDLDGTGGGGDGRGREPDPLPEYTPPPEGYRIAIWLTLISVTMLFLALASAYVFTRAPQQPIATPRALWISTAIILASSVTMEIARRGLRRRRESRFKTWIGVTMVLGFGFLVSQVIAWRQLVAAGYYVNRNLHSGLAYLFTGLHAAHLVGGLIAVAYMMLRTPARWTAVRRRASMDATALYWHFIDVLWVFLLALVFLWK